MKPEVDTYLNNLNKWQKELTRLREIIVDCGLNEEYKWMHPCYTYKEKNIVLIHEFKNYCAILFHKGALLSDQKNILVQQTENTQSARQIRFTDVSLIEELKSTIKEYIYEAIEVEKAGLKVKKKKTTNFEIPEELNQMFKESPEFKKAFENLTPGRQRGYLLHFTKPKQAKTRVLRIKKSIDRILEGYGLNDCTCGLSKRKPNCDGSHKQLESVK
ncbi:DUF1801 domain-containing protein [Xanthomarina spongicola]|uniref:Uncharacterized protein YdeI (YjbR/CyaY-like superfamily) n=1 Tax=Xanthomarina spongicola TaxID=570520 RepID=A0A316DND4_9FLAO|nr:DUF1801 domain-containing protein [Xanthomarina spongicola]PWK19571.1 uncharacterized protein YdeI (YjbR/CyaY-like superfamily) [Xanthomarina spongicola]